MKKALFIFMILSLVSGCTFLSNTFEFKDRTEQFVESLLDENYEQCVELFAMDHEMANNTDPDSIRTGLDKLRNSIPNNFGSDLDYTLMKSRKVWSTKEGESTPPNTTIVFVQFSNETHFGVIKALFDDNSKKIMNIKTLDVKQPIPNMAGFWLFGLVVISVPIFNIYVIRLIKKSDFNRKWTKYIAVLFFNVPSLTYNAVSGLSLSFLSFQFMLGMSFNYMGYLNSAWTLGIPLGGLYYLWKLKKLESTIERNDEIEISQVNN